MDESSSPTNSQTNSPTRDPPSTMTSSMEDVRAAGNKRSFSKVDEEEKGHNDNEGYVDVGEEVAKGSESSYDCITPHDVSDEDNIVDRVKDAEEKEWKHGERCFACDREWLEQFKVGFTTPMPDNSTDLVPLSVEAGDMLKSVPNFQEDYRRVLKHHGKTIVEPFEPVIHLRALTAIGVSKHHPLAKHKLRPYITDKVGMLMDQKLISVDAPFSIRLWQMSKVTTGDEIGEDEFDSDLGKVEITEKDYEKTLLDLGWPKETTVTVQFQEPNLFDALKRQPQKARGKVGLSNLGNTCYMNSALQCLLHVEELSCYFMSKQYKVDLNVDNPIGHDGNVARAFARLVTNVFADPDRRAFSPSDFKSSIGKYNQQFNGYQQQDSQELLAFLLDGLHEDLNRILKKPATEKPELPDDKVNDEMAIAELAKDCWEMHKKRNDSVVLDLFAGLYRSVLVCPDCDKVSITFDPFMDLTLPLPVDTHLIRDVTVMQQNSGPQVLKIAMNKHDSIADLKRYVGGVMSIDPQRLHVADIFNHKFFAHLQDNDILSVKVTSNDVIVVYEVDRAVGDSEEGQVFLVPVVQGNEANESTGWPFYITMTDAEAQDRAFVEQVVAERAKHMISGSNEEPVDIKYKPSSQGGMFDGSGTSLETRDPPAQAQDAMEQEVNEEGDVEMKDDDTVMGENEENEEPVVEPFLATTATPPSPPSFGQSQYVNAGEMLVCVWHAKVAEAAIERFDNEHAEETQRKAVDEKSKGIELDDCLDLFSKTEVLGQDDLWYCNRCKEMRQATKTIGLWTVPDIFTVHLKRFSSVRTFSDKISNIVQFPIEGLDMSKRVLGQDGQEMIYDLFAVDNHFGGIGGGHYTAYAKNFVDDTWYYFDDSSVRPVENVLDMVSAAAYLLFYRRRRTDGAPLGPQKIQELVKDMRAKEYECEAETMPAPAPVSRFGGFSGVSGGLRSSGRVLGSDFSGPRVGGGPWHGAGAQINLRGDNNDDDDDKNNNNSNDDDDDGDDDDESAMEEDDDDEKNDPMFKDDGDDYDDDGEAAKDDTGNLT